MDRLIYTALSGMQASMDRQRAIASNLANTNTLGFRAELIEQRAMTVEGHPNEARAMQGANAVTASVVAALPPVAKEHVVDDVARSVAASAVAAGLRDATAA